MNEGYDKLGIEFYIQSSITNHLTLIIITSFIIIIILT